MSMVTPSLLLLWYFHSRDVYPEPGRVVWTTFVLGVLTAIPVLLFAIPMETYLQHIEHPIAFGAYEAFVLASIPEETFKFAVLLWYVRRHSAFDEPMDGLVYGVAASLGFATLENVLYVAQGGLAVAILRAVTSLPAHATFGAIMGYYIGQSHFGRERRRMLLFKAWLIPVLLHGLYDTPLLSAGGVSAAGDKQLASILLASVPVILLFTIVMALRMARGLRARQLASGPSHMSRGPRAWAPVIGGGFLLSCGGLALASLALAWAKGALTGVSLTQLAVGVLLSVLAVCAGLVLFRRGTWKLNQTERAS